MSDDTPRERTLPGLLEENERLKEEIRLLISKEYPVAYREAIEENARLKAELQEAVVRGNVFQVAAADWEAKWQREVTDRAALKARLAALTGEGQ